jgi:metal-responsive CopG/Arc/MetJ family transcriptional regulator
MKIKTSITLSSDTLLVVDTLSTQYKSRSEFIELAIQAFIKQLKREEQDAKDLAILNQYADQLNEEATDVLAYQIAL